MTTQAETGRRSLVDGDTAESNGNQNGNGEKPAPAGGTDSGAPLTPRDVRRDALRDLILLATQSAATETKIETDHKVQLDKAKVILEKATWAIGQRFEGLKKDAAVAHKDMVNKVRKKFSADIAALKAADKPARTKIQSDYDSVSQTVKSKTDQAAWMADSALEIAVNQLREQEKQVKDETVRSTATLGEIEQTARARATRYGLTPGPATAPGEPDKTLSAEQAAAEFTTRRDEATAAYERLRKLFLPGIAVGSMPFLISAMVCVGAAAAAWAATGMSMSSPNYMLIGIAAGAAAVIMPVIFILLRGVAKKQVAEAYSGVDAALAAARRAAQSQLLAHQRSFAEQEARHRKKRDAEVRATREQFAPAQTKADQKRAAAVGALDAKYAEEKAKLEAKGKADLAEADARGKRGIQDVQQRLDRELAQAKQQFDKQTGGSQSAYSTGRAELERRLREGLASIQAPMGGDDGAALQKPMRWNDPSWATWKTPKNFAAEVRFGEMEVDLHRFARNVPTAVEDHPEDDLDFQRNREGLLLDDDIPVAADDKSAAKATNSRLALPPAFAVPATLTFPRGASLLIQADKELRADAIQIIQMVMARLLTTLPAGRVHFTLIDPVGLGQNFAGFMHLADHDDALIGGRIWTEGEQIDQRLANLTAHMETVIQKYLRNEYETIDQYNAQAGELAEPYRFLVISDFPAGFSDEALRRLSSIATTGARCGVYTIVYRDTRQSVPHGTTVQDLEHHSVNIVQDGDHFVWKDEVFAQFPLALDPPADEDHLTKILDTVGRGAKEAKRVEVSFDTIAPKPNEVWTMSTTKEMGVPVGRMGATKLQYMKLGRGVAQHVLIAGKTGSGKSTLLHAMITNLAMWYSPNEVEFYLIDFKKGVEFKTYATHRLPHARAIAVESDREFGLSVLQRLDAELARRGELFRKAGAQDLASYRGSENPQIIPRTLLVIDEFQEFFSEDDKLAQDTAILIDRLVRQGRAFGMHVLLGSQTIGGSGGLNRATLGQMAVRIALQTSDADSQLILGDNNGAAKLLTRPGEAIYNDQGGLVEANSPFQIAWLPDERREKYLGMLQEKLAALSNGAAYREMVVFEGNAPADLFQNKQLNAWLKEPTWPTEMPAPRAFLGDPVAIKDPSSIPFRRQSGSNVLIVGQQDEQAMAMMSTAIASIAIQQSPAAARFYVFDGSAPDSPQAGVFATIKAALPHDVTLVEWRNIPSAINELAKEMQNRQENESAGAPSIYVLIYGLQRYRMLKKGDDDFSFSSNPEEKPPDPGKQFADLLREGPALGIHTMTWIDTPVSIDRILDRGTMREFDNRVLFQMSANDSSNLIDSPTANKLGQNRALSYSEEQGAMEKFRPYAIPNAAWLEEVKAKLGSRSTR